MATQILIQPAALADLETMVRLRLAAFETRPITIAAYPTKRDSPEEIRQQVAAMGKSLETPSIHIMKAVTADGLIVGGAWWKFYYEPRSDEEWNKERTWPPDANVVLCQEYFGTVAKLFKKEMYGKAFATLSALTVLPGYQRKGIGEMLLREGLQKADEAGLPVLLAATVQGIGLYRKMGFQDGEFVERDLRPYGVEALSRDVVMTRPAKNAAANSQKKLNIISDGFD